MKIKVDRTKHSEEELVFTITVSDPHHAPLSAAEKEVLETIDRCTKSAEAVLGRDNDLLIEIKASNHEIKALVFDKLLSNLRFAIENQFRPKFKPICEDIFNWIFDFQQGHVKMWMQEFNPERITYYFDNDARMLANNQLCHDSDDEEADEDDDEED